MKHSRTLALRIILGVMVLGFIYATYLFFTGAQSIVYRYTLPGNPTKEPEFAIFNPFRDQRPEKSADAFLRRLQSGDCENAMRELSAAHPAEYQQVTCERERTLRLISWTLTNRTDQGDNVRLYYEVSRNGYFESFGQVWVTVEKTGDNWRVTRYDRSY